MGRKKVEFPMDSVVRYRKGETALMQINSKYDYGGIIGVRFEGTHCCGDYHEAYESDCVPATEEDLETWTRYSRARNSSFMDWSFERDDVSFDEHILRMMKKRESA